MYYKMMKITKLFDDIYCDGWYEWQVIPSKFKYKRTIYHMTTDDDNAFVGYEDDKGRNFLDKINARDCLDGYIEILERL